MKITIETPVMLDIRTGVRMSVQHGVIVIDVDPEQSSKQIISEPEAVSSFVEEYTVPKDDPEATAKKPRTPRVKPKFNLEVWSSDPAKKQTHPPEPAPEPDPVQIFPYVRTRSPESEALEEKILTHLKAETEEHQWYTFSDLLDAIFPEVIRRDNGKASKDYNAISTAVKRLASLNVLDVQRLGEGRGRGVMAQYRLHTEE